MSGHKATCDFMPFATLRALFTLTGFSFLWLEPAVLLPIKITQKRKKE
jgi:hypothetical protein